MSFGSSGHRGGRINSPDWDLASIDLCDSNLPPTLLLGLGERNRRDIRRERRSLLPIGETSKVVCLLPHLRLSEDQHVNGRSTQKLHQALRHCHRNIFISIPNSAVLSSTWLQLARRHLCQPLCLSKETLAPLVASIRLSYESLIYRSVALDIIVSGFISGGESFR